MNYIEWHNETPAPHDRPSLRLPDASGVTHVAQLYSEVNRLREQLTRAQSTADFLAASGDALRAENEGLREENSVLRLGFLFSANSITMNKSAIDKAPPGVRDWLKAFGVYDSGPKSEPPVSEPEKPIDPRSNALGRAMGAANRTFDGYGR